MAARTLVSVALGVAIALLGTVALAAPSVRLSYAEGPGVSGCPPESALTTAVVARLGENPFHPGAARIFQVQISARGGGLEGTVTLIDEQGRREGGRRFESSLGECSELMSAMALAISLAINPNLALDDGAAATPPETKTPKESPAGSPVASPAAPPPAASPSLPSRTDPPEADAEREGNTPWRFAFGAGINGAIGAGPEPALGVIAFGRVRHERASLALEVRYDAPFDHTVGGDSVHAGVTAGVIAPCVHLAFGRGCAIVLAGDVAAGAHGVDAPRNPHGLFVASGLRAGVEWPLIAGLGLTAQLDGLVTVKPVRIVLDGQAVWETPPLSAALAVGVFWQIP